MRGDFSTHQWNCQNGTATASGDWSGRKSATGTEDVRPVVTSAYILSCSGAGGNASDTVTVSVSEPTVTASVASTPETGIAPLTVVHTIIVGGSAKDSVLYSVSFGDETRDSVFTSMDTAVSISHSYQRGGVYRAKATMTRQGVSVTATGRDIAVTDPTVSMAIQASRSAGYAPLTVTFNVQKTEGTATGPIRYRMSFNGSTAFDADTTTTQSAQTFIYTYTNIGVVTARACITQQDVEACGTVTITAEAVPPIGRRAYYDRPNDFPGKYMHGIYVSCLDCPDFGIDTTGVLNNSMGSFQNWFAWKTRKIIREDMYRGQRDISYFKANKTMAEIAASGPFVVNTIYQELRQAGFDNPDAKYLIYYAGYSTYACGGALYDGPAAAMYLGGYQGVTPCGGNVFALSPLAAPGYWEFAALHDFVHTLGYVDSDAPNHDAAHPTHTGDSCKDLMGGGFLKDGTNVGWCPSEVDPGNDDYYGDALLENVRNLKFDDWLIPAPASTLASVALREAQAQPQKMLEPFFHEMILWKRK